MQRRQIPLVGYMSGVGGVKTWFVCCILKPLNPTLCRRPSEKQEEEVQDWVCSGCTAVNFARRTTCFKVGLRLQVPDYYEKDKMRKEVRLFCPFGLFLFR